MQLLASKSHFDRLRGSRDARSKSGVVFIICILVLGGLVGLLLAKNQSLQKEAARSHALTTENETLKEHVAEMEAVRAENQSLQELRKDHQELLRLRNEVSSLRTAREQLTKLQGENTQLKSSLQQLQAAATAANTLRTQNEQLQGALAAKQQEQMTLVCIDNLTRLQAVKAAWAQDNGRQPTDVPQDLELFGPNRYLPQKPKCPGGGAYTLGAVQQNPACTLPGHAL